MVLFEKFGQHQPLNRQSERYAREGVGLSLSTLADQVGACAGGGLHPLPRRWTYLPHEQRGRTSAARPGED